MVHVIHDFGSENVTDAQVSAAIETLNRNINGQDAKIRLLELDTPEISLPKCDAEFELASKARDFI